METKEKAKTKIYYRTHFGGKVTLVQSPESQKIFNYTNKHFYLLHELYVVASYFDFILLSNDSREKEASRKKLGKKTKTKTKA